MPRYQYLLVDSLGLDRRSSPDNIYPRYIYLRDSIEFIDGEDFVEGDLIEEVCFVSRFCSIFCSTFAPGYVLMDSE